VRRSLKDVGCKNVEIFNCASRIGLPLRMDFLKGFHAVISFSYFGYKDAKGHGDVLADYVDSGYGGVVIMCYSNAGWGNRIFGRWNEQNYDPITPDQTQRIYDCQLQMNEIFHPNHPIMRKVRSTACKDVGGIKSYDNPNALNYDHENVLPLTEEMHPIAYWNNGQCLISELKGKAGKILSLNLYPVEVFLMEEQTDAFRLITNSLLYVSGFCKEFSFNKDA